MVTDVSNEYIRGISDAALGISVVLAGAPLPDLPIVNVSFAGRMPEAQKSTRKNGNWVLEVGDTSEPPVELIVDVVGEILVSDLCNDEPNVQSRSQINSCFNTHSGKSVTVVGNGETSDMKRKEYRIQERDGSAKRVSDSRHGLRSVGFDASHNSRENSISSPFWHVSVIDFNHLLERPTSHVHL